MMTPRTPFPPPFRRAVLVILALAMPAGLVSAQSLGELARQEEERRKAIKTPSPVYTNDNIRPEPRPAAPPAPAPAAAPPSSSGGAQAPSPSGSLPEAQSGDQTPAADAAPPEAPRDEAYWRQRVQAARDALARAQVFAEALQSRINALTADFTARDDPAQRATIADDRQKALAELDRVQQEIQQHTKAIADIQDEARRAAVPPGWLR